MNRIDEVIVFNSLMREQLSSIVEIQLEGLRKRLSERGIAITLSEAARQVIGEEGYDRSRRAPAQSARFSAWFKTRSPARIKRRSPATATRSKSTPGHEGQLVFHTADERVESVAGKAALGWERGLLCFARKFLALGFCVIIKVDWRCSAESP